MPAALPGSTSLGDAPQPAGLSWKEASRVGGRDLLFRAVMVALAGFAPRQAWWTGFAAGCRASGVRRGRGDPAPVPL